MKTKTKKYKKENSYQVGIISYNMNTLGGNFGAALHSWAFQKYLDKINVSSVIIDYKGFKYHHHLKKKRKNLCITILTL